MNSSSDSCTAGCGKGCLTILIAAICRATINSILVVFLWNWLMPDLFGLSRISFFQAIGISFLLGLLYSNSSTDESSSD